MSKLTKAQSKTGRNERILELEKSHDKAEEHGFRVVGQPDIVKKRCKKVKRSDIAPKGRKRPNSDSGK